MRKTTVTFGFALIALAASSGGASFARAAAPPSQTPGAPNTLTPAEAKAGWRLLFDGKTAKGWRALKDTKFPSEVWTVADGAFKNTPAPEHAGKMGTDIVTENQYDNFELVLEFKLAPGGNSGIKYLVDESKTKTGHSGLGFEFQILDDETHPDAKQGKAGNRTAGSLYDLIAAPADKRINPPGQWNQARLVVDGAHVEHWLNGKKTVEYERGSAAMKTLIAGSKYKSIEGFGEVARGHILLQDHGERVEFRSIKLRPLPPQATARK